MNANAKSAKQGSSELFPCPCCGYLVFEPDFDFGICPVCEWEDDRQQLTFLMSAAGAKSQSLYEYQQDFLRSHSDSAPTTTVRDPLWRPFDPRSDPRLRSPDDLRGRHPADASNGLHNGSRTVV